MISTNSGSTNGPTRHCLTLAVGADGGAGFLLGALDNQQIGPHVAARRDPLHDLQGLGVGRRNRQVALVGAATDGVGQKIARIDMNPDTSFLNDEQRQVVNLLIQASDLMSEIYLRQYYADNPALRQQIANSSNADRDTLLAFVDDLAAAVIR